MVAICSSLLSGLLQFHSCVPINVLSIRLAQVEIFRMVHLEIRRRSSYDDLFWPSGARAWGGGSGSE